MKHPTIILTTLLLLACTDQESTTTQEQEAPIDLTGIDLSCLDTLHEKTTFKTYDRTLADYINSNPNRPTETRNVIYLLPLGDMSPAMDSLLQKEVLYLKTFFQMEVRIMDRVPFNDLAKIDSVITRQDPNYNSYGGKSEYDIPTENIREQIDVSSLIKHFVKPNMPEDGIVILGITDHDIYSPKYNWLYGSSNIKEGTACISTHRLKEDEYYLKMNIRKAISKQLTNAFSIKNVKDYHCLLTFHNNIQELEAGVLYLSPRALEKLTIAIGFDHATRFEALRKFWIIEEDSLNDTNGMSAYYSECLRLLGNCK